MRGRMKRNFLMEVERLKGQDAGLERVKMRIYMTYKLGGRLTTVSMHNGAQKSPYAIQERVGVNIQNTYILPLSCASF